MASVGQELLDVPLPDMVTKLALGIADAQRALDENSVETAELLADTTIEVIPSFTQTIAADGGITFEASIEVTMDIKTTTSSETNIKVGFKASVGFAMWSSSVRVDVSHNRKFQKEVHGTSRLFTKMVPVPPPARIFPEITVIDLRPAAPPPAPPGG
jgi:hypothetical protein